MLLLAGGGSGSGGRPTRAYGWHTFPAIGGEGEPDWEVRAGFLEEVMPGVRKGPQSSIGKKKGWTPGWVGGRKHSWADGIWTGTGLAIVTVLLGARWQVVVKGCRGRTVPSWAYPPPTSSILLSFWGSVTADSPGVILAPFLSRIIPASNQLPRSREPTSRICLTPSSSLHSLVLYLSPGCPHLA